MRSIRRFTDVLTRRRLLRGAAALPLLAAPAIVRAKDGPAIASGLQFGDVSGDRAVLWAMADRPARLMIEWDTRESFAEARRLAGPWLLPESGFTGQIDVGGLPQGQTVAVRAWLEDADGAAGPVAQGRFRAAPEPHNRREIRIAWSGDQVGQGYGIDVERGGMAIFSAIADWDPDVFIHSGDQIYADSPLAAERRLPDGTLWRNLLTPAKSKVAESLDEFRGNYIYNFLDDHVRRFQAQVPKLVQWDDHDVRNNWYPGRILDEARYTEKRLDVLAARARRAFFEMNPVRRDAVPPGRIYRTIPYGDAAEIFLLDGRSYRGSNPGGIVRERGPDTAYFGGEQLAWLKAALKRSRATWKIIACDQPIGLLNPDGVQAVDGISNGIAELGGREFEIAELLSFMKQERIHNTVWVTAEVHHAAAYRYEPGAAVFTDFDPFWEFVAGPLHAGCLVRGWLDPTFGPDERFLRAPAYETGSQPPTGAFQSFGSMTIDPLTHLLTARLHGVQGEQLYAVDLEPRRLTAAGP